MANSKGAAEALPTEKEGVDIKPLYLEALTLVERLHRRLLDVIKDEFDRSGRSDVNGVQALLLFNIGESELTAGELRTRGYYLGSNVSYNLKKLVEMGYIHHQRSRMDRRSVRVSLTDKGHEVADIVNKLVRAAHPVDPSGRRDRDRGLPGAQPFPAAAGAFLDRSDPLSPLSLTFAGDRGQARLRPGFCSSGAGLSPVAGRPQFGAAVPQASTGDTKAPY